jgi:S-DNA-T family DNA segregation ATPase FtsK/SpoIIIE
MREILDYQADQIERVLASHGVPGRIYGGAVSPRLVEFHLAPAAGVKLSRIEGLAEELAMYLGVAVCRVQRRGAVVAIEVPKEHAPVVRLLELIAGLAQSLPPATAVLGQDNEGMATVLRLPSPDVAHTLITGTTGSGKTELAKSMILSLALCNRPDAVRLLLIDPKGRGYRAFAGLPHLVCPVVSDVQEAHDRLAGLVAEMERRDKAGQSEPRVVVFVDELADLMMVGGKQMIQVMTRLTQRGREAGIHIVACTQKPTAGIVGGLVKSNFPARLVGSVASADDARIAAGVSGTGAEKLAGRGDFLLIVKGEVQRLQAAYAPADELRAAVQRLATGVYLQAASPRLPHRVTDPSPTPRPSPAQAPNDAVTTLPPLPPGGDACGDCAADGSEPVEQVSAEPDSPTPPVLPTGPFDWRAISTSMRIGVHR